MSALTGSVSAELNCRRIAEAVIAEMTEMQVEALSGDDSGLRNVWEEVCVQIQTGESVFWDVYEDTMRAAIEREVARLAFHEGEAIWRETPAGMLSASNDDEEVVGGEISTAEIVELVLTHQIYPRAADWSGERVEA